MRKFSKRLLTWLLAAAMVFGLSGMTAFAAQTPADTDEAEAVCDCCTVADDAVQPLSDTVTSETHNHGTMTITSTEAEGNTITMAVGDEAEITIHPYAHNQYTGCTKSDCPDGCASPSCFTPMYGCGCNPTPLLRYADVDVNVADDSIVSAGAVTANGDAEGLALSETMDGTLVLTANEAGTTRVTVTTTLRDWFSATETFTVTVEGSNTEPEGTGSTVNYAVKIWGIETDTYSLDDGETTQTAGLTFGPAVGGSYLSGYKSCDSEYCIHNMTWDEIIAQSKADPTVFESCKENGCTKAVELTPNETLFNMETVENAAEKGYTGDGVTTLLYLLNGTGNEGAAYAVWNASRTDNSTEDPANVYSRSRVRATLTGDQANIQEWMTENPDCNDYYGVDTLCDESNCLLSCFPEELQAAVLPRTTLNSGNATRGSYQKKDKTTYDKLFLFSVAETGITNTSDDSGGTDYGIGSSGRTAYEFSGTAANSYHQEWWTRSGYSGNNYYAFYIGYSASESGISVNESRGLSPGFCLPGPEWEETVDKTELENAVAEAEGLDEDDYTADSWAVLQTALAAAQGVLDSADATQGEVDEALLELETAMNNLESLLKPAPAVVSQTTRLRQSGDTGSSTILLSGVDDDYRANITEITLSPVETDEDGNITGPTTTEDTNGLVYPKAPKEITLSAADDDFTVSGNTVTFSRTEEEPIVYVTEGHGYPYIVESESNGELTRRQVYTQTQVYEVTVKADGYKDAVGTTTYYTGTSAGFSIIEDLDGNRFTTDDQKVLGAWTSDEIQKMASFANGSSQCGMTGFRTFTTSGVSLVDLMDEKGIKVSAEDAFLLQTADDYGNEFSYADLFGVDRYFLSGIYDPAFVEIFNDADNDADATGDIKVRRWLADYALEQGTTIDPRICINYNETMITGTDLNAGVSLPTEENTVFNSLVSFENQYRFVYGIMIRKNPCTVTFDTQGGSDVEAQTVLSHNMTYTGENTTMSSSYWANSLIIYRGEGDGVEHPEEPQGADTIAVPDDPTKDGYVFAGWYTDEECTDGNEFDFEANDGTVDENTTLYAKWVEEETGTVDKEELNFVIGLAAALDESKYTADSWEALQTALAAAQDVAADEDATQEAVDEATDKLAAAIANLQGIGIDKTELTLAIAFAEMLDESDYTADSWAVLQDALAAAQAVEKDEDATQEDVDEALSVLEDAIDKLDSAPIPEPAVDKERLEAAIADAEDLDEADYTADSWAALQDVLDNAKAVDADEEATQDIVDGITAALLTAIDELEPIQPQPGGEVDKTALSKEVAEDTQLSKDSYTSDSWAPFATALSNAESVLADPDATQDDVDDALLELQTAKDNLEPAGGGGEYKDGLIKDSDGVWRLYKDNVFQKDYTGFAENKNGDWYVEKGIVTFNVTDILKDKNGAIGNAGDWYYVIGSKVQKDFTGLSNFKNESGWWYIVKGKVDFTRNSVDKNNNGWFYVEGGKVRFDFTGLSNYKNDNGWWYISGGKVNFSHNGVDKNKNGWFYVLGGKVRFDFTGLANYKNQNGWWYIAGGKVMFDHNGVEKNKNGWFYVKNSKVDFSFTGIASNKNGSWYITNGKVNFGFSGTVTVGGTRYTVKGGKVS